VLFGLVRREWPRGCGRTGPEAENGGYDARTPALQQGHGARLPVKKI
jgi:hypothetical protein